MIKIGNEFLEAEISQLGAALNGLWCANINGDLENVVLGLSETERLTNPDYLGVVIGPIANRLANAKANFQDRTGRNISLELAANEGKTALHGGQKAFSQATWQVVSQESDSVTLGLAWNLASYPGNFELLAEYRLQKNSLVVTLSAKADTDSLIAMTLHPYWNLSGQSQNQNINNHQLYIPASKYLEVDDFGIPLPNTPSIIPDNLSFIQPKALPEIIDNSYISTDLALLEPKSRRFLQLKTNQPAIQVYTGDFLSAPYYPRAGVAIEAQAFPNAANRPDFPSIFLAANTWYRNISIWSFQVAS